MTVGVKSRGNVTGGVKSSNCLIAHYFSHLVALALKHLPEGTSEY